MQVGKRKNRRDQGFWDAKARTLCGMLIAIALDVRAVADLIRSLTGH